MIFPDSPSVEGITSDPESVSEELIDSSSLISSLALAYSPLALVGRLGASPDQAAMMVMWRMWWWSEGIFNKVYLLLGELSL